MFEEFRLHPDAVKEMTAMAAIRMLIIFMILPLIYLIKYLEGDLYVLRMNTEGFSLWFIMLSVLGIVRVIRTRQYAVNFKLLCLGDTLKFSRGLTEVNLPLASISKTVVQPDGSIMIYTSSKVPFLYISRHLEKKELLLNIISGYAPVEHSSRKHLIGDPVNRLLLYGALMMVIITFITSQMPIIVVPLGILLLGYIGFQFWFITNQRAHLNSPVALVLLVLMALFFLARIVFIMGVFSLPNHF